MSGVILDGERVTLSDTVSCLRLHLRYDDTRPVCSNLNTILAKSEPSTHDPKPTFGLEFIHYLNLTFVDYWLPLVSKFDHNIC